MDEENLLFEAGVYYRFPDTNKPEEECPRGMMEFRYERFKNGKSFGIGRVFTHHSIDFYKLLDNWNHKGISGGYTYIGQISS